MKIRTRIILAYLCLVSCGFYYLMDWILEDLRPRYMESVEESLVDTARILAGVVSSEIEDETISTVNLNRTFQSVYRETFEAQIYQLVKTKVDLRVLVTDRKGIVIFDSRNGAAEGQDFSEWNDVHLTLQGKYGARSTAEDPNDPDTSSLYVAAPVKGDNQIMGVLTVAKPKKNLNRFIRLAQKKFILAGILATLSVLFLGVILSHWITQPIHKLITYTEAVAGGKEARYPSLGNSEVSVLGKALEDMRQSLEGKKYIEEYITNLTHELKSPLSALRGSAELLKEEMPKKKKEQFLSHVLEELSRMRLIIDKLLDLSSLESRSTLQNITVFELNDIIEDILESLNPLLEARQIQIQTKLLNSCRVQGEKFLIRQALSNLVYNALEFSPDGKQITIGCKVEKNEVEIKVSDEGEGIPDYALPRIFERFYSLPRPGSQRKSTGLGLCFVQNVAALHGGQITMENLPEGGAQSTLVIKRLHKSFNSN